MTSIEDANKEPFEANKVNEQTQRPSNAKSMTESKNADTDEAMTKDSGKDPEFRNSVYSEVWDALICSGLVYDFAEVIQAARDKRIKLKPPEGFSEMNLKQYLENSMDLTQLDINDGNGMSFSQVYEFATYNATVIEKKGLELKYLMELARDYISHTKDHVNDHDHSELSHMKNHDGDHDHGELDNIFLTFNRCLQGSKACVYSVIKDRNAKRIAVVFRGTVGVSAKNLIFATETRDWRANLQVFAEPLETPENVKGKIQEKFRNQVLVHRGHKNYLWDNEYMNGDQRGKQIMEDIQKAINGEKGYTVTFVGHSLGGALATMASFSFAGAGDWLQIPRPITCINFGAPYSGTYGYKQATEIMERDGLLRLLRVNVPEDAVPKTFFCTWPFSYPFRRMCHTGINLRLTRSDLFIEHSSQPYFLKALRNGFLDVSFLLGIGGSWHGLPLHGERLLKNYENLKDLTIEDLYKDKDVVGKGFLKERK